MTAHYNTHTSKPIETDKDSELSSNELRKLGLSVCVYACLYVKKEKYMGGMDSFTVLKNKAVREHQETERWREGNE